MTSNLQQIKASIYDKCSLIISNYKNELEGKVYGACTFKIAGFDIICRDAKVTPKKVGQFVTFWKRLESGEISPFHESDIIDFYVVNVKSEKNLGQFVFPKSTLIKKGIISTQTREGKRGFRVYPAWDTPNNKLALKTQKWQLDYFYEAKKVIDINLITSLYT
ncbi:MepB family protein [Dokdonia sp. PRO95]|uniref:MepB family protein n=1 Tax=Dokdonia sp. PRO95 TaxID=1239415 RepID=UPI0005598FF6|nr:MepB family protein [Dokdonia sp. PRO95]